MNSEIIFKGLKIQKNIASMLEGELKNLINLIELQTDPTNEHLSSILRALHRLKGSTGFIGLSTIEEHIRTIEHDIKSKMSLHVEGIDAFKIELNRFYLELSNALS